MDAASGWGRAVIFQKGGGRALTAAASAALLAGLTPSPAHAGPCKADQNIRIMTWNVHVLTKDAQNFTGHHEDQYGQSDGDRMRYKIVPRIRQIAPDIVVLQEAFRFGDSVDEWWRAMTDDGMYPWAVLSIDDDGRQANSGLMLFSRWPLVSLAPNCINGAMTHVNGVRPAIFQGENGSFDKGDCFVNTRVYNRPGDPGPTEIFYPDAWTAKAAAIVRVQAPGGCFVNVAFTHMTATYNDDDDYFVLDDKQQARETAQKTMADLIMATLTETQVTSEPLFYVGDFNTDGNPGPDDSYLDGFPGWDEKPTHSYINPSNVSQWARLFRDNPSPSPTNMFTCGFSGFANGTTCLWTLGGRAMTDAWAFEHPWTDHGVSDDGCSGGHDSCDEAQGERLDYILHNHPLDDAGGTPYLCASHIQRLWPDSPELAFETPPGSVWTDHLAVFADFARTRYPQCNPIDMLQTTPQVGASFGSVRVVWPEKGTLQPCQAHTDCPVGEGCPVRRCAKSLQLCASDAECAPDVCLASRCTSGQEQDAVFDPVTLHFARNHKWFIIPADNNGNGVPNDLKDVGTVSIGTNHPVPEDIDIRVYQERDLSWPIPEVHQDTVDDRDFVMKQYFLDEPPYYVRVSVRDGAGSVTWPGLVTLKVIFRKNGCSDPYSDVCVVTPNKPVTVGWPGPNKWNYAWDFTPDPSNPANLQGAVCTAPGPVANAQSPFYFDHMYFRFVVDRADDDGAPVDPDVQFDISNTVDFQFDLASTEAGHGIRIFDAGNVCPSGTCEPFNVKLCDCDDPFCPAPSPPCNQPVTWAGFPGYPSFSGSGGDGTLFTDNLNNGMLRPTNAGAPRPFILRIHRTEGPSEMSDMQIVMRSDMTYVTMKELVCRETWDDPTPHDEIRLFVKQNGVAVPDCNADPFPTPEFSQSMHASQELTNNSFKGQPYHLVDLPLEMRMCEYDSGPTANEHYVLDASISPLGATEPDPNQPETRRFCGVFSDCSADKWEYELLFSRIHEKMTLEDAHGEPEPPICP